MIQPVDLHCHSHYSDGTEPPAKIMRQARRKGIRAIALTDHDTVEGLAEMQLAATDAKIDWLSGIEMSAEFQPGTLHILGYCFDPKNAELLLALQEIQQARAERNPKILAKLQALGVSITWDEVVRESEVGQVGRPHFARVLVRKRVVRTFFDAFDQYLGKGKPAHEEKFRYSPARCIEVIRKAGGVAVLAHPIQLGLKDPVELEKTVKGLADLGLGGIEAYSSSQGRKYAESYVALGRKLGLIITGGSDYHGQNKSKAPLGFMGAWARNGLSVVEALREKAA